MTKQMTESKQQYAVTITLISDAPLVKGNVLVPLTTLEYRVSNRPLAPEGLSISGLRAWLRTLSIDEEYEIRAEVDRFRDRRFNSVRSEELRDEDGDRFTAVGGDSGYRDVDSGEEFGDGDDALLSFGFVKVSTGQYKDSEGHLESLGEDGLIWEGSAVDALAQLVQEGLLNQSVTDEDGQWPPMWNWVWQSDHLGGYDPQEVADFTGFTVFQDTLNGSDGDFVLGVQGAGYDFYDAHWLPLAYRLGALSN